MIKEELDIFLDQHDYLNQMKEEWDERKKEIMREWEGQINNSQENAMLQDEHQGLLGTSKKKLEEVWIEWRPITGAPSSEAAMDSRIPMDIQNELKAAMSNNECNGIRTPTGFYYVTADKDGNNTIYVDSRWLESNPTVYSTPQDYLKDIQNIIGDNQDIKITDVNGKFRNETLEDFLYKADKDYGLEVESMGPKLTPS